MITCSQFMLDEVRNYFNVPLDKIDVVPNGLDASPFDELDGIDLTEFRARWLRPDERIVFNVGRVVQEKGAQVMVKAAPRVLVEMPNTKFIIAGKGNIVDDLKRRVWELGVQDKVVRAGFISDPDRNRLFKVADAAIFPSLYEPFGIVALEAMAAQCPVIVSEVGGLKEVVQHDVTGVTIYPDNVESLVWGVLHTLRDPKRARVCAAKAYRVVKEEYNWDRTAERTIAIYERIVRERAESDWSIETTVEGSAVVFLLTKFYLDMCKGQEKLTTNLLRLRRQIVILTNSTENFQRGKGGAVIMAFVDKWLICVDCGCQFLWDAGEQAWFSGKHLENQPKRCGKCRDQRRDERLQPRPCAQVNCSQCGAPTYVPFVPRGTKPVYCRMCLTAVREHDVLDAKPREAMLLAAC